MPLAGCAVGPDYVRQDPASPSNWSDTAGTRIAQQDISHWWLRLNDPLLNELIASALHNSPDMRSARAKLLESRSRLDLSDANLMPRLNGALGTNRSKAGSASPANQFNAGFDASWEIDLFGGLRRASEAAEADAGATLANLYHTQVTLAAEVALNYVQLRSLQQRLAIARDNLAAQRETLRITEWRTQAGLVTSMEVEQANSNLQQTLAGIPTLATNLGKAENRLAVLLGQVPTTLHEKLSTPAALPPLPDEIALSIPADTLRQRPDVQAAERRVAAETARIGQESAARYPSFSLSGSLGWKALTVGALGDSANLTRSLSASLAQTIFDGGRLSSRIEAQNAVQQQALIAYEQSVLLALEEMENALTSYANSHERRAALQRASISARNAALMARQRYEGGLIDFQSVLDTDRTLLSSQDSLASAELEERTALIGLYKAMGGGWNEEAALPVAQTNQGSQP
ncbi:MAG: efflux transporter outer membrane subunit [Gammaproteobacteria bacterium]|nr:efflux transporter outer membrane subunit [Gammaproteobacteria bacterium]MBU1447303.1 efflux transporter outer membrane subunit [Gammaproteobacteria bacterium]